MIDPETLRGKAAGVDIARKLREAVKALERLEGTGEDICYCSHQRQEHINRAIGCVGGGGYCECRRFTLDRMAFYGVTTLIGLIRELNGRADSLDPPALAVSERSEAG